MAWRTILSRRGRRSGRQSLDWNAERVKPASATSSFPRLARPKDCKRGEIPVSASPKGGLWVPSGGRVFPVRAAAQTHNGIPHPWDSRTTMSYCLGAKDGNLYLSPERRTSKSSRAARSCSYPNENWITALVEDAEACRRCRGELYRVGTNRLCRLPTPPAKRFRWVTCSIWPLEKMAPFGSQPRPNWTRSRMEPQAMAYKQRHRGYQSLVGLRDERASFGQHDVGHCPAQKRAASATSAAQTVCWRCHLCSVLDDAGCSGALRRRFLPRQPQS